MCFSSPILFPLINTLHAGTVNHLLREGETKTERIKRCSFTVIFFSFLFVFGNFLLWVGAGDVIGEIEAGNN